MTNTEYEAASIAAAGCYDRFEGEHKLKQMDEIINNLEKSLANLHEQRREIVNQYNLNKCKHDYVWHTGYARWYCSKCEAAK
ncbi:hypothetical protein MJN71_20740 [Salmonella enterica subsp. enterica serovar Cerro]|nr:hypothetical protein [Salmonella enterica subsp. enterica serovar Cerro]MEB8545746.1 hypothetical protein [Salmonella enterica subsp. enterica serovar Cerro]